MSAIMDTKYRRERQRNAAKMRDKSRVPAPAQSVAPDLSMLQQIANAADGWHAAAVDPYKKAHLRDAGLVTITRGRIKVTEEGRRKLEDQRWATAHDGRVRPSHS
jgi:hypothetical protein